MRGVLAGRRTGFESGDLLPFLFDTVPVPLERYTRYAEVCEAEERRAKVSAALMAQRPESVVYDEVSRIDRVTVR